MNDDELVSVLEPPVLDQAMRILKSEMEFNDSCENSGNNNHNNHNNHTNHNNHNMCPELIITVSHEFLENGLSDAELDLILKGVNGARRIGKKLSLRIRFNEKEQELIHRYGGGDRDVAIKEIITRFYSFFPVGSVESVFGTTL